MNIKGFALACGSIGLVACVLSFNNCSPVSFAGKTDLASAVDDSGLPSDPPSTAAPPPPDVAIANCQQAAARGVLLNSTQDVVFEDTKVETGLAHVCPFGIGDNLSAENTYVRARYEQSRTLALPAGAVLCGVEVSSPQQSFKYDDVFFITFNGTILASNLKPAVTKQAASTVSVGGTPVPLYQYDWLTARGTPFENDGQADYCLGVDQGLSTCQWPITEQAGTIKFNFAPEILINIGLKASSSTQQIGFVTTGDNDLSSDCYHERLQLVMKTFYYLQ